MSKNLFRIPSDAAGLILSFLTNNEALIYILMYKILNKVKKFIPKDYEVYIENLNNLPRFSSHKDIKRLRMNFSEFNRYYKTQCIYYLSQYTQLESYKNMSFSSIEEHILPHLINLKELSITNDTKINCEFLSKLPKLEKLSGVLSYKMGEVHKLDLTEFRGWICQEDSYDPVDLASLFNVEKMVKLDLEKPFLEYTTRKITSLEKFNNLKELIINVEYLNNYNCFEFLRLEKLTLYGYGRINLNVISLQTNLKYLKMSKITIIGNDQVPGEIMLNNLEELDLIDVDFSGERCVKAFFEQLTKLKDFRFFGRDVSFLEFIPSTLLKLYIKGSSNFDDFVQIQRLTSLKHLTIFLFNEIKCFHMKCISKLANLESLTVLNYFNCEVIHGIESFTKLKKITLENVSSIGRKNIDQLKRIPGLEIVIIGKYL